MTEGVKALYDIYPEPSPLTGPASVNWRYSRMKMGARDELDRFAKELVAFITSHEGTDWNKKLHEWCLVFQHHQGIPSSTWLLANLMKNLLSIPAIVLINTRKNIGTLQGRDLHMREEMLHGALVCSKADADALKGKNILLIDDSFVTGAMMAECVRVLNGLMVRNIKSYVVARITPMTVRSEEIVNQYALSRDGAQVLAEILNDANSWVTTRLIAYVFSLSEKEIVALTESVTPEALLNMYVSSLLYFNSNSSKRIDILATKLRQLNHFPYPLHADAMRFSSDDWRNMLNMFASLSYRLSLGNAGEFFGRFLSSAPEVMDQL